MNVKKVVINDDELAKSLVKINDKIPEPLPKASFAMLILAQRNSGKTNLLINMLLQGYKGIFNNDFVFSPTVESDAKWSAINISEEQKFTEYDDEYLQSIIDFQELPENKKKFALVIFDDAVGLFGRNSLIANFLTRARWYRISIIFSIQYTKAISPLMRNNLTSVIIIGNMIKREELKKMGDILDPNFDIYYKQLKHKNVSRYNFILIDWQNAKQPMTFNFNNKITLDDGTSIYRS